MFSPQDPRPIVPGSIDTVGMKFAVVVSRFNSEISNALRDGAMRGFADHGVAESSITTVYVPGAFEIPVAAQALADTGDYAAIIGLGAVIRGETAHFEYVAGECARGIQHVSLETGIPVMFGVLTTDTLAHAQARSGTDRSNKGWECAAGAIEMAAVLRSIRTAG